MSFFKNVLNKTNGKVAKLEILPRSRASELVYSPHLLSGGIVLASGSAWDEIVMSDRSGQLEDNSEILPGGVLTAFRVGGNIAKITRETAAMLYQNQGNPFYLRVTLIDGTVLLLSDMKLDAKLTHGQLVRDFSGFRINFASRTSIPPLFWKAIPAIGDTGQAGGKVFYVDKVHHLVFEANTSHSSAYPYETGTTWPTLLGTFDDIGGGKQNTALMLALEGSEGSIADDADGFSLGGYADWFVPSINELKALYDNLHEAALVVYSPGNYVNSSSEADDENAKYIYWPDGSISQGDKTEPAPTIFVRMYPLFP